MQPLDLDVQDAIGGNLRPAPLQPPGQFRLVLPLDGQQLLTESAVLHVVHQPLQLPRIPLPLRANGLGDEIGESRVAAHQPAAEGDTVCFIVELLWVEHIEGVQLRIFQDFGVQLGHTVDLGAAVDIHVGHVDDIVRIPDGKLGGIAAFPGPLIQGTDKRQ